MALNDPTVTTDTMTATPAAFDPGDASIEMREDWDNRPWPTRYIVRTIDLVEVQVASGSLVVPELRPFFRENTAPQDLPPQGIQQVIRDNAVPGPTTGTYTPIDLVLEGDPVFVVFVLGKPNNMRFHPDNKGITHKNPDDRLHYGYLRHAKVTGGNYEEDESSLDDCRIIYFIADPLYPPQPTYKHGFNLNVRLLQPPAQNGTPRFLDVVIDPDVRYPGGEP